MIFNTQKYNMNKENKETIADIITEARGVFDELRKHGYNVVSVDRMADIIDRVEEAHKREREAGAEAAQICGEIVRDAYGHDRTEHDARLIAAAPELYEALRMYQEAFAEIRKSAWFLDANFHEIMSFNKVMTAADAAIAKAAGESETISQPYRGARRNAETTEAKDPTHSAVRKG